MKTKPNPKNNELFYRTLNRLQGVKFIVESADSYFGDSLRMVFVNYAAQVAFDYSSEEIEEMGFGFLPKVTNEADLKHLSQRFQEVLTGDLRNKGSIALTIHHRDGDFKQLLGIISLLEPDSNYKKPQMLCEFTILEGDDHTENTLDEWCRQRKLSRNKQRFKKITKTEMETINLIIECKSTKEMSESTGKSINTIKSCLRDIFAKLEVRNRKQLIKLCRECGLV